MPGEAAPTADQADVAATGDATASSQAAGERKEERSLLVAWTPNFAFTYAHFLKEAGWKALEDLREVRRNRTYIASDVFREVGAFGYELVCYADEKLCELTLMRKFEQQPLTSVFPVVAVGLMMSCIGLCYTCVYMPAMHIGFFSVPSFIFQSSFCLAMVSYHQGVVTHPGAIPSSWKGESNGRPRFVLKSGGIKKFEPLERKKTTNGYRYCKNEGKFKPDRAHYCKLMGQNVLRMDHYCPWLANCVGFRNYKYFLLTLCYDSLAANIASFSMIHALHVGGHSAMHIFMLSQGVVIASVTSSVLTPFFLFHCWLLSKNLTTIEYCEAGRGSRTQKSDAKSPYDMGFWHNASAALGLEWYFWPLPTKPILGDGLNWEVAPAFRHKKMVLPNLMSTVISRPNLGVALRAEASISSSASEGAAPPRRPPATVVSDDEDDACAVAEANEAVAANSSGARDPSLPFRKKCLAARDGGGVKAADAVASVSAGLSKCSVQLGAVASGSRQVLAELWQQKPVTPVPHFVRGGLMASQECAEDLYSYTSDKARDVWSWCRPAPVAPPARMASTVSRPPPQPPILPLP